MVIVMGGAKTHLYKILHLYGTMHYTQYCAEDSMLLKNHSFPDNRVHWFGLTGLAILRCMEGGVGDENAIHQNMSPYYAWYIVHCIGETVY